MRKLYTRAFRAIVLVVACTTLCGGTWIKYKPEFADHVGLERVHDGDTIIIKKKGGVTSVRLAGIDAPELAQPGGVQARDYLRSLLEGHDIRLVIRDHDRYDRAVADVYVDGHKRVNADMVLAGWAWWYKSYALHDVELQFNQSTARELHRGLWAMPDPVPPWEWRHSK